MSALNLEKCKQFTTHYKKSQISENLKNGIFEPDSLPQSLSDVTNNSSSLKHMLKKDLNTTSYTSKLQSIDSGQTNIRLMGYNSFFYKLLSEYCYIPTLNDSTPNLRQYTHLVLALKPNAELETNYQKFLSFLIILNLDLNVELLIYETIFKYIENNFSNLVDITNHSRHSINMKSLSLDKIKNDCDLLISDHHLEYSKHINGFLSYFDFTHTSQNEINFSNFQILILKQQLRFYIFEKLSPLLSHPDIKINIDGFVGRDKVISSEGCLAFKFFIKHDSQITLSEIQFFLKNSGLMIFYNDLKSFLSFKSSHDIDMHEKKKTTGTFQLDKSLISDSYFRTSSPLYSILFRLLDIKLSSSLDEINNLYASNVDLTNDEKIEALANLLEKQIFLKKAEK